MSATTPFLMAWLHLEPLLAQGNPRGTWGGPIWWFGLALIVALFGLWTFRALSRKNRQPPPPVGGHRLGSHKQRRAV